jgi:hypothetical protein
MEISPERISLVGITRIASVLDSQRSFGMPTLILDILDFGFDHFDLSLQFFYDGHRNSIMKRAGEVELNQQRGGGDIASITPVQLWLVPFGFAIVS